MAEYYDDDAIDAIISNLDRIPREIDSKILIDDISQKIMDKLRKKTILGV